jgi:DNA-binding transcriptional LysR family regulator
MMRQNGVWATGGPGARAIDLVSIAQAIVAVECLSFRRAAKVLEVRQSVLSRRVRALEDALGVSLFERYRTGVRVTAAGARFLDEAQGALLKLEAAIKSAGAAGRGSTGRLRLGILSLMAAGFLREVILNYQDRDPGVTIEVREGSSGEHIACVREGQIDVAFAVGTPDVPDCGVAPLWTERLFIALPKGHILCARNKIEWLALRGEPFIVCQSERGRAIHDNVIKRLAEAGDPPNIRRLDVARETLMHLVALRQGISVVSESAVATSFPDVEFRPLTGNSDVLSFSAVWAHTNDNPAFRRFLSLARAFAKDQSRQPCGGSE